MHIHNKICEKREKDRKKGEEREGCERHESGSPAKMARESKVLTLSCVAGFYPCYSNHKDTIRHSALPRDQIILYWKMCKYSSLTNHVPAFWRLPSYRRVLLFPSRIFRLRSYFQ